MAGPLDSFEKLPIWQRIVMVVLGAALIMAAWFFFFYEEAVANTDQARQGLETAKAELARVEKEKEKYLERERKMAELEAELDKKMEVLPMSTASVDNLMQTFQQQARLVGLTVESWTPEPEQKEDFYARLPVKVRATGTWAQAGEFFRRVSELDRIVSVENVSMKKKDKSKRDAPGLGPAAPQLELEFEAATYRFLTDAERAAASEGGRRKRGRRRK